MKFALCFFRVRFFVFCEGLNAANYILLTDAEHDMRLRSATVAKKVLDSAKEVYSVLSDKYKQAKDGLDKLLSGIITTARAEGKNSALNEFQSDINATSQDAGMKNDGLLVNDGVLTELPSPVNVSIDGDVAGNDSIPLAQPDGSGIINEGTQKDDGDWAEDAGKPGGQAAGARDFIDGFKNIDGKVGGKIPVDEFT